jgi:Ca2+-binding RTX toxin-like protein
MNGQSKLCLPSSLARTSRARKAVIAGTLAAALLGVGADQAAASYTGRIQDDTLTLTGNSASDKLALFTTSPTDLVVDVGEDGTADFTFDRTQFSAIVVNAGGGDDEVRLGNTGVADAEPITVNGGNGADRLIGDNNANVLNGDGGNDFVDGNIGADTVHLGAGNDTFQWDPGDGSDVIEGEGGNDVLDFNGSNIGENIDVSANGERGRLTRNVASITQDFDGIEAVDIAALGGADNVTVNDLAGTAVKSVDVNLAGFDGQGDAAADTVTAVGTEDADTLTASSPNGGITVGGVAAVTHVVGGESADSVNIDGRGGDDTITGDAGLEGPVAVNAVGGTGVDSAVYRGTNAADTITVAPLPDRVVAVTTGALFGALTETLSVQSLGGPDTIAGVNGPVSPTEITLDGGAGDDNVRGTNFPERLLGGGGNDHLDGNIGTDTELGGAGADTFQWDPGDGSDTLEGEGGTDLLDFNGSNIGENIDVSANGARGQLTRNVASITQDFDGIEGLDIATLGGADNVTVNDTTGTAIKTVDVNLAGFDGLGDATADNVIVNGTEGSDSAVLRRVGTQVQVRGLAAQTRVVGSEPALDTLRIQTLGGDDRVTLEDMVNGLINPVIDLGADD